MWFQLVLLSSVPIAVTATANNMCPRKNIPEFLENRRVTGSLIKSLTTSGLMSCARVCLLWSLCNSFSFNSNSGLCEMSSLDGLGPNLGHQSGFVASNISAWSSTLAGTCANHQCLLNAICDPQPQPTCEILGCLTSEKPLISHALTTDVTAAISPVGTSLNYDCEPDFLPSAEMTCKENGRWTSPVCHLAVPTSCLGVKQCQPTSTDGDYWIRLPNFDFYRTRVYCHDMINNEPKTFLTLQHVNFGEFPNASNQECQLLVAGPLSEYCAGREGNASYQKIRINLETMIVNRSDYTFANISYGEIHYGEALDCYAIQYHNIVRPCGTAGRFNIDLSGTGWIVHPNQTWTTVGWASVIESTTRKANGTVIELRCGGWPGGCGPKGGELTLVPNPGETPNESSGVISCT